MKLFRCLPSFTAVALLASCGGAPDSTSEIEMSYGALDDRDEAPLFDSDDVRAEDAADRDVDEPADPARDGAADEMRRRPDAATVILTLRYGNLAGRERDAFARWPFEVNAGGVITGVRLGVDDREDPGLLRRAEHHVLWASGTEGFDQDGARMRIDYALDGDPERGVSIETNGIQLNIPFRELSDHRSYHRLPQGDLFVNAYRARADADPEICRGGMLRARVSGLGPDGVGQFFGVFTNHAGDRIGHLRGRYGHRLDGTQPIFGKMITRGGGFEARFRGLWERDGEGKAQFRARLHGRGGEAIGVVRGALVDLDRRGGAMIGRWALECDATIDRSDLPAERDDEERARPTQE